MAILESPGTYAEAREAFRRIRVPYLFHCVDATPDDYEQLTDEDLKCEFVDGELIVHSPASLRHEDLTAFVIALLREFVIANRVGRAFGSNAVMQLGERRFSPDVSVLKDEHVDRVRNGRVYGPMDLAAEVISSGTRVYDHATKLPAYREGRVGEIWLVDAEHRQFEVHALRGESYITQTLATGRWSSLALPGFSIQVDWLWADPLPALAECRVG
jgi:Uma2 family endonuclease